MKDFKLPVALIFTMIVQACGLVYWVSQQAATIDSLKEDMAGVASRMAIEDQVNLRRDVTRNTDEIEMLWEDMESSSLHMEEIINLKQRLSILEKEVMFFEKLLDPRN
jgi:hypothetical protein